MKTKKRTILQYVVVAIKALTIYGAVKMIIDSKFNSIVNSEEYKNSDYQIHNRYGKYLLYHKKLTCYYDAYQLEFTGFCDKKYSKRKVIVFYKRAMKGIIEH